MRLTREKVVHLSHVVTEFLESNPQITLKADRNDVRLLIVELILKELKRDEAIDKDVRKKISSMKSNIPEGSPEWDALYYKMYEEAMDRSRRSS